ncbi:MAG: glycoside hydrolase family 38 C-terminal domain-containing protein [Solirubrobacteraceae bacterium]
MAPSGIRRFVVVPHTHWDREWYAPFEHFRLALGRVVDEVIEVLERDPLFSSFTLDGQAIVLEDYRDVRPDREPRLRALLAAGRIEVGPSYVLPDELLVGGESLVRNLLAGRRVCERFGAPPSAIGYLPDSFGHPLQLPQVLAGFGIESMIFSRGLGDQLDELGVVFRWRAPDGSEVLAIQQLADYGNFAAVADADDGAGRARAIVERFGGALQRAAIDTVLLCNGSDHLPVQPELPRLCAELEQRLPGAQFQIGSYGDYVAQLGAPDVPAYAGELLGSRLQNVLRGVNSARLYLKAAAEQAERRLLGAETRIALATLREDGKPFAGAELELAWRELLRCEPHDSICGCSCDEVHRDMLIRYASLQRTLDELAPGPPPAGRRGAELTVEAINVLPYRRRGLIQAPGARPAIVELNGFAAQTVRLGPGGDPAPRDGVTIESDRLRVDAAADGTLTLLDKASGRRLQRVHGLEDEHDMGDLYNFCPVAGVAPRALGAADTRVLADGPDLWELEVRRHGELAAGLDAELRPRRETVPISVTTVVRLVRGADRVEFSTTIDNAACDHRLRATFPVGGLHDAVRAEGQFAVVRRPLVPAAPKTRWAEPPDLTQHTLGIVALGRVALITKGLPEYQARRAVDGSELCLTLLRCVGTISRGDGVLATRPSAAGPPVPTPDGQCLGRHQFSYALLLDADELDDCELLRASQDYRYGFELGTGGGWPAPLAMHGDVVFSCLKGAEDGDGLILRCFNPAPAPAPVRVVGAVEVSRTRLDETGEERLTDGAVRLAAGAIATLRLRPGAPAPISPE